jgi:hypothetical protein
MCKILGLQLYPHDAVVSSGISVYYTSPIVVQKNVGEGVLESPGIAKQRASQDVKILDGSHGHFDNAVLNTGHLQRVLCASVSLLTVVVGVACLNGAVMVQIMSDLNFA